LPARRAPGNIASVIYCVVPRGLEGTLYPKLVEFYKDDENVTVIVDRRHFDRRARRAPGERHAGSEQRVIRDRRRARVAGDLLPLASGA
jgi:hypothetical protein